MTVTILHWLQMLINPAHPFLLFGILLVITHLFYLHYFKALIPQLKSGAVIMALGVFLFNSFLVWHVPILVMMILTLELLIISLYLEVRLIDNHIHHPNPIYSSTHYLELAIWIISNAILAILFNIDDEMWQGLHGFIITLAMLACLLLIAYFVVLIRWLIFYFRKKMQIATPYTLVLSAVSVEVVILLINDIFNQSIPLWFYDSFVLLGFLLYCITLGLVVRYFYRNRITHAMRNWQNTLCLIYSALAFIGIAVLNTNPDMHLVIKVMWGWTLIFFIVIELISLSRLFFYPNLKRLKVIFFTYHPTQWYRVFAFNIVYTFTALYSTHMTSRNMLAASITRYGFYVIMLLVLIELIAVFHHIHNSKAEK